MAFPDPRFFAFSGPCTPEEAASLSGATVVRSSGSPIETVAAAEDGGPAALVFLEKGDLQVEAGAVIVPEKRADELPRGEGTVLTAASPKLAFAMIAASLFRSRFEHPSSDDQEAPNIAASAHVDPSAVILPGAVIGDEAVIGPQAVIGHGVKVGKGTVIGPHVSITHAELGEGCHILAGARIGEAGFGFVPGPAGPYRMPQLGAVRIGYEVEIGANTTVDRGTLSDTVIGDLTKIDNLCQIAHNCILGRGVLVASQTGISGSCVVGDYVMMGGQVGMADHLTIGRGAVLAARAGLMRDVEDGAKVGGAPAKPVRQWMKETAALSRLAAGKS